MKTTKKDKQKLENILADLKRTRDYILKDSTIFASKSSCTAMPEHTYINKKDGHQITVFNKHIGNNLCYLYNAIERLEYLLKEEEIINCFEN